jgi:tetratricopeptide (TPR) repeat protein
MSYVTLNQLVEEARANESIRRQVEQSGRPFLSHAATMSDDELLAKLRGLRLPADREALATLCEHALSAEDVAKELLGRLSEEDRGFEEDWVWICLVTLWERWWPDKPCMEFLDDKMQAGYDAEQRGETAEAARIWLEAWADAMRLCDAAGIGSIREFDDRFPMTQYLFNWCQDLEMALQNGGLGDPELRAARLEMSAEWLRRFAGEDDLMTGNFRRALADSHFETGQPEEADRLYEAWLDADPAWGWGWIGWADCYTPFKEGTPKDYPRAEQILRRGLAAPGVKDAADIAERLADVCEETGRADEARELREQAERQREREQEQEHAGRALLTKTAPARKAAAPLPVGKPGGGQSRRAVKTGRNEPCPCGSGKKFKKCHGAPGQLAFEADGLGGHPSAVP